MVEIKEEDNINNYLELDDNLFKNEIKAFYKDISIYTIQYPLGNNATVSYGLSNGINDFEIHHTCSTEHGSSGSPILNLSNFKVIGIHTKSAINFNFNIGTCLQFPFNEVNNNIIKEDNEENNKIDNDELNKYEKIIKKFNEIIRIINDVISNLYQIGSGPKINVIFNTKSNNKFLVLKYGTTVDQMLKIYLIRFKEYSFCIGDKMYFSYNCKQIKLGDKTPIEKFFEYIPNPRVFADCVDGYYNYYEDKGEECKFIYFCRCFIPQIINFLDLLPIYKNGIDDITIKFNNRGKIVEFKKNIFSKVADLIHEYYEKTNTKNGTFIFGGHHLPVDFLLYEAGLKNNSEIIVV